MPFNVIDMSGKKVLITGASGGVAPHARGTRRRRRACATGAGERNVFRIFEDFDELSEANILDEAQLSEVASEMGEQIVQVLDI